jgi:ABC-type antimicrobial peptide transport system permease subunit
VYALLALAIIIAILGVVNILALSVVERTREIGLLRAIGTSRLQIRRMIQLESILIAVFGSVTGLALGLIWALALQNAQGDLMDFTVPRRTVAPRRVGKPLGRELAGSFSARRGPYRLIYDVDDDAQRGDVLRIDHRSDVYRPR